MELIKHGTRPELQLIRRKHSNAVPRQLLCQRSPAVVVFEGGDTGCDYTSMSTCSPGESGYGSRSPALTRCGCVSCKGCPNWRSAADANVRLASRRGDGLLRKVGIGRDAARNGSKTLLFIVDADGSIYISRWKPHLKRYGGRISAGGPTTLPAGPLLNLHLDIDTDNNVAARRVTWLHNSQELSAHQAAL